MKKMSFIIGLLAIVLLWVWSGYNGLITAKEGVDASWAQVETQYQRRFDLIPNLVSTVEGASEFEQETFTDITKARTQWQEAGNTSAQIAAANDLDSALARLLVTVENYPNLKATQAYRDLLVQLEGTENRIAVARRDYNEIVRGYNVVVKRFPKNVLAGMFGFYPEDFFETTDGSENAPKVEF